jgi:hypothetical protein
MRTQRLLPEESGRFVVCGSLRSRALAYCFDSPGKPTDHGIGQRVIRTRLDDDSASSFRHIDC